MFGHEAYPLKAERSGLFGDEVEQGGTDSLASKRWVNHEPRKPRTLKITFIVWFNFAVANEHGDTEWFALIVAGEPCQAKCCEVRFVVSVVKEIKPRTFDRRVGVEMAPLVILEFCEMLCHVGVGSGRDELHCARSG